MCLLVVAWLSHPRYRLVLAGNRDEFHDRPTAPLDWWNDQPDILAGRDLRAGGTWLGVARSGRIGFLTNVRDAESATTGGAPSRGALVTDYLRSDAPPAGHLQRLHADTRHYAGFNLLLGDRGGLHYYCNAGTEVPRALPPGLYGVSNHRLDEPSPKLVRTRERLAEALVQEEPAAEALLAALLEALADDAPDPQGAQADSGLPADLERALTAPFVRHPRYGTRSSTVVLVEHGGRSVVHERRYDPAGAPSGAARIEFQERAP
jgi:uncharacterized protein with NRDE domain